MTIPDLVHLGVTVFLFACFCGCVIMGLNPARSTWWLGWMLLFLILAAFAAGYTGWSFA